MRLNASASSGLRGCGGATSQVVQPYAAWKAPGARDLQLFLAPLHVDGTTLRVVPVDERVSERLTECGLGIGGYRHAKHPELQLFPPFRAWNLRSHP